MVLRVFPEARRDELAEQTFAVEHLFDFRDAFAGLLDVPVGGNHVVIVKLHAVKAEFLVFAQFQGEFDVGPNHGAERVGALADIPRPKSEAVGALAHGRRLRRCGV